MVKKKVKKKPNKKSNAARKKGKNRTYTSIQKKQALLLLKKNGNMKKTSLELDIPYTTIREWRDDERMLHNSKDPEFVEAVLMEKQDIKDQIKKMDENFVVTANSIRMEMAEKMMELSKKCNSKDDLKNVSIAFREMSRAIEGTNGTGGASQEINIGNVYANINQHIKGN